MRALLDVPSPDISEDTVQYSFISDAAYNYLPKGRTTMCLLLGVPSPDVAEDTVMSCHHN